MVSTFPLHPAVWKWVTILGAVGGGLLLALVVVAVFDRGGSSELSDFDRWLPRFSLIACIIYAAICFFPWASEIVVRKNTRRPFNARKERTLLNWRPKPSVVWVMRPMPLRS